MKTVFLHGLGQTARAWDEVVRLCPGLEADCPDLFSLPGSGPSYDRLRSALEGRYAGESGPLRLCGLSLGAVLALDYAARHPGQVRRLVLIAPQYRTPRPLFALQDVMFHLMPESAFREAGLTKREMISLTRSMGRLDLTRSLLRIACPAEIVCGARDRANRKAAQGLLRLLPLARLHLVPEAGHEVNRETPEALAGILAQT